MTNQSYYTILGVSPNASQDEITTAYRQKVKECHPDRSNDPGAAETFKQVQEAKAILTNEHRRARYDRLGHHDYITETDTQPLIAGASGSPPATTDPSKAAETPVQTSMHSEQHSTDTAGATAHAAHGFLNSISTNTSLGVGTASRTLFNLLKTVVNGTTWLVETIYQSVRGTFYGMIALALICVFVALAAEGVLPMYARPVAGIIAIAMWAYTIMDWKIGISGYGVPALVLAVGNNQGFVPGGNGFNIIMTFLIVSFFLACLMKANYERRATNPPSVMDKLAGWDVDNDDTDDTTSS